MIPEPLVDGVGSLLERVLADRLAAASSEDCRFLWSLLAQAVRGGKMVRPLLVTTVATQGGSLGDPVLRSRAQAAGAAFELLHAGLVVHDDIMDGDVLRRGRPTVPAALEDEVRRRGLSAPEHTAVSAAIIVGDLALTGAYRLLVDTGPHSDELFDIMDRAVRDTAEGQLLDILGAEAGAASSGGTPTEAEVLELARLKTSAYSFEAPVAAGAVLSGLDDAVAAQLLTGARSLGTAFQVVDDIIGAFGEPSVTGKSASDLVSRKRTVLTVHAATARTPGWEEVWAQLGQETDPQGLEAAQARARELLRSGGSLAHAQELSTSLHEAARHCFTASGVPQALSHRLVALTDTLEARYR